MSGGDPQLPGSGEFDLIRGFFLRPSAKRQGSGSRVLLGIGDDAALLAPRPGYELAVSTDMLVAGQHFFPDADPVGLGWKALAVNLSDLAAMGAEPLAFTLALALPDANHSWLADFASGLFACADQYDCPLVGGDTTRGPLNLCITIFGEVPARQAVRRDGARAGDDVWVSGQLGDAALGLRVRRGEWLVADATRLAALLLALDRPQPRVDLGIALRGIASAMIDVSDGLVGDLGHLLQASGGLGAEINVEAVPLSEPLRDCAAALRWSSALAGGDDYELCFTAPARQRTAVLAAAAKVGVVVTRIGIIQAQPVGLTWHAGPRNDWQFPEGTKLHGYDHFA